MISRRCLLALPAATLLAKAERETEYLALDLLHGNRVSRWEQPDKAVSMGSLLKPFLVVAALALEGMQRSAERGTARGLGLKARGKTGTAPCSHTPRTDGDGFTVVLYPLDRLRLVLLARQCGTTGAHTAQLVRPILEKLL
ncbi:MAG TPA: hypothetical protein VHZ07_28055 [Bryobacteraceae bacterium]|jgi:hypothetical protein|nr:hypothetical protein [Bryobacteraceae bacterium]